MNVEEIREYCLQKKGVAEGFPFDDNTLVFKVGGKMFALVALEKNSMSLKCDPAKAIELREQYTAVMPGYHMNKAQWNTIDLNSFMSSSLIAAWIDHSYQLVVEKLPKRLRATLFLK
jgi:predicted DNA-binding protein (MmcQ/YjbR family)